MKILFLGDSITEGYGASIYENSFVPLVAKELKAEVKNFGIGGTRFARQYDFTSQYCHHNNDFVLRVDIMDPKADAVVVLGGTNDFGHGSAPLGKSNSKDVFTFNGAVNTLFKKLIKKYDKEKIMVVLPLPRFNEDSIDGDGANFKKVLRLF